MDDQAETLLLRLFRGSGITGLSAMSPKRGSLIRPLIQMRRNEIRRFLDEKGYAYLEDPTNLDLKFKRNMVRHTIIPMLESRFNAPVVSVLARTASVLSEEDAFMEEVALRDLRELSKDVGQDLQLDAKAVGKLSEARRRRVVRAAIRKVRGDLRGIGSVHIEALVDLIRSRAPGKRIDMPSVTAYRDYDRLLLSSSPEGPTISYDKPLEVPGVTVIREADISFHSSIGKLDDTQLDYSQKNKVFFDLDGLALPISVRNRRPGDRFVPFASSEPKKLKEVFIDDKVSRRLRDSTPIVVDGEGILWIPGGRRSDRAPITETTERILCIEARKSFNRE
jgi:tRNA(Ile)-lysidine synthase